MSWDAVGAVAELVGAAAVVITLAFLTVQLRQNTLSTRAAITQSVLSGAGEFLERVAADPDLSQIWARGLREVAELAPAEQVRFGLLLTACFRRWEAVHLQHESGVLPAPAWESLRNAMRDTVAQPGGQVWWAATRSRYNERFRAFIDGLAPRARV